MNSDRQAGRQAEAMIVLNTWEQKLTKNFIEHFICYTKCAVTQPPQIRNTLKNMDVWIVFIL